MLLRMLGATGGGGGGTKAGTGTSRSSRSFSLLKVSPQLWGPNPSLLLSVISDPQGSPPPNPPSTLQQVPALNSQYATSFSLPHFPEWQLGLFLVLFLGVPGKPPSHLGKCEAVTLPLP